MSCRVCHIWKESGCDSFQPSSGLAYAAWRPAEAADGGPFSIGAQMGLSLSLSGYELFLALLNADLPPTQHPCPGRLAHGVGPRLPGSQEVLYAG
jgi:hypothetical protein